MGNLWKALESVLTTQNSEQKDSEKLSVVQKETGLALGKHKDEITNQQETSKELNENRESIELNLQEHELALTFSRYLDQTLSEEDKGSLLKKWKGEDLEGVVNAYIKMSHSAQTLTALTAWVLDLAGDGGMKELLAFADKLKTIKKEKNREAQITKMRELNSDYLSKLSPQTDTQSYQERETTYVNTFRQLREQDEKEIASTVDQDVATKNISQPTTEHTTITSEPANTPQNSAEYREQAYASTQLERARQLFNIAEPLVGKCPYKWGSKDPTKGGIDCSGFINWLFKQGGYISPGGYSSQQYQRTKENTIAENIASPSDVKTLADKNIVRPGDLIFWHSNVPKFHNRHGDGIHHVGMIGEPAFITAKDGEVRLNVLESSGSGGVQYIENGLPITYHNKKAAHHSTIRITRQPFIADSKLA